MDFKRKFYADGQTNGEIVEADLGSGGQSWEDIGLTMEVNVNSTSPEITQQQWIKDEIQRQVRREVAAKQV